jgi:hypothetical protein
MSNRLTLPLLSSPGDDTGWHGVGWHQSVACKADPDCHMQTPRMDALVAEGVEIDQVTSPPLSLLLSLSLSLSLSLARARARALSLYAAC